MNTIPKGFRFAVANAEFRTREVARNDLGLIICDVPTTSAAVFTTNLFQAAPVLAAKDNLENSKEIRAIMINSGQANACTGDKGMAACLETQRMIEKAFDLPTNSILPASTGVIGAHMDLEKWKKAISQLQTSFGKASVEDFARSIMTTDAFPKFITKTIMVDDVEVRIAAIAKGAGMICPNMATMLSMVITDAKVTKEEWQEIFHYALDKSFNRVTVDGDTSTNDCLFGLASGQSVAVPLDTLKSALTEVLIDLSYLLVKDGEGATKVMHIDVSGAKSDADADAIARTIAHSQLVKTAIYGKDPNWGRIVAAAGRAGVSFNPNKMQVILCGIEIFNNGEPADIDIDALFLEPFENRDIPMQIILQEGDGHAHLKASDLSHAYVSCNADYRT